MSIAFSNRTRWDLAEEPLTAAIREARSHGRPLVDLTVSNPTVCGFDYSGDDLLRPLTDPQALRYHPEPRGLLSARQAVVDYYAYHRASILVEQVLLTTSTSEAYSFLFRLLCDPGDEVLVAQPGYPLFDFIADLDDVRLLSVDLFYDFGWWIDFSQMERCLTPRTRAILLVHPNNPTGHATSSTERLKLEEFCAAHDLALIVDEVFLDYSLGEPIQSFATGEQLCLKFVVSGLSKVAALPQMKIGWMLACGPKAARHKALARLEIIADTFLSVNAPAQYALPHWLAGGDAVRKQILERLRRNLDQLKEFSHLSSLPVEAGWSCILRLPQRLQGHDLAERICREIGVLVHPGSFYALPGSNLVVSSLLVEPDTFGRGCSLLNAWCEVANLGP